MWSVETLTHISNITVECGQEVREILKFKPGEDSGGGVWPLKSVSVGCNVPSKIELL